ncbi:hypothetical protein ACFSQ7_43955 [Paenibacillus rhizoplanae]
MSIFNGNVADTLHTEDSSLPKPYFDISFDVSNSNLETSYRWISDPGNDKKLYAKKFRVYESSDDVGAAEKTNLSGTKVLMDGRYILEYRVKKINSLVTLPNFHKYTRMTPIPRRLNIPQEVSTIISNHHNSLT